MPYTSPATQSSGATAPASWAAAVKAGLDFQANPPSCRAYNTVGGQSLTNAIVTPIALNSERWDTDSMHSTSVNTSRLTINTAGLYVISAALGLAAGGASGIRVVGVYINGGTKIIEDQIITNTGVSITVSTTYKLNAGEYIEMYGYQVSGGALATIASSAVYPELSATWIGTG